MNSRDESVGSFECTGSCSGVGNRGLSGAVCPLWKSPGERSVNSWERSGNLPVTSAPAGSRNVPGSGKPPGSRGWLGSGGLGKVPASRGLATDSAGVADRCNSRSVCSQESLTERGGGVPVAAENGSRSGRSCSRDGPRCCWASEFGVCGAVRSAGGKLPLGSAVGLSGSGPGGIIPGGLRSCCSRDRLPGRCGADGDSAPRPGIAPLRSAGR